MTAPVNIGENINSSATAKRLVYRNRIDQVIKVVFVEAWGRSDKLQR